MYRPFTLFFVSTVHQVSRWPHARESHPISFEIVNLRDYAIDSRGTIDGRPYGGSDGMILRIEPLVAAIEKIQKHQNSPLQIMLPTPEGQIWSQQQAEKLSQSNHDLIWICPRFGGYDIRLHQIFEIERYSIGSYIVSSGDLPALMMTDSIVRLIPGVVGNSLSPLQDSLSGAYDFGYEEPQYTRPTSFRGFSVPIVLTSGDHGEIAKWRHLQRDPPRKAPSK